MVPLAGAIVMHRFIVALAAFFFTASAVAADLDDKNYTGDDAGSLVMVISHLKSDIAIDNLFLNFRKIDRSDSGYIAYSTPKTFLGISSAGATGPNFTLDDEMGSVIVRSLPPGDYEFFQATALQDQSSSRVRYSVPFTIKAKETTYLGTFQVFAKLRVGTFRGATAASGFYFIVSNKSDRDLELARGRPRPPTGSVTMAVPDVSALDVPLFRTQVDSAVTSSESASSHFGAGMAIGETNARTVARTMENLSAAILRGDLWPYHQVDALNLRGVLHLQAKRLDEALADFNAAIAIDRFAYVAYSNRGAVYRARGEFDLAIADQTKALSFFPDYAPAYIRRAITYVASKKLNLALADVNEAVRLEPENAFAYFDRGTIHRALGNLNLAIADFSKAIEIKRFDEIIYEHYNARGYLYLATDDYQKAFADFDKVLYGRTGTAENYAGRCLALIGIGDARRAVRDCDKALSMNATRAEVLHARGLAHFKLGQYSRALDDFSTAYRLDPGNPGAIYGRGLAKAKMGDGAAGTADMDEAKMMNPGVAAAMAKFGATP